MDPITNVNIASPEFKANPYPFYARLRAEAPVYRVALPSKQTAWLITRYDDVVMALKEIERFDLRTGRQTALGAGHVQAPGAQHARPGRTGSHAPTGAGA
jgi:cytochrome P450